MSIPVAILIWLMIYPMMLKVDFNSIKQVGQNPKGLIVTWITNWLIKPFTMYGITMFFFYVVFKGLIPPELAVAVAILLFGLKIGATIATVVGVLVEVPVMLTLVRIANNTRGWFEVVKQD